METPTPQIEYLQYAGLVARKRKWMMLGIGLTSFAVVQFFGYLVTPVWEGTAMVLVERTSKQNLSVFRDVDMPVTGPSTGDAAGELVPLLTGQNMAYDMVREFGLDNLMREKRYHPPTMRDMIKGAMVDVIYSPLYLLHGWEEPNWTDKAADDFIDDWIDIKEEEEQTSVIDITVYGETTKLAADVANAMAASMERRTQLFSRSKASESYPVVARQVAEAAGNLKQSEEALIRFQEATGVYGADENRKLLVQKLDQLRTDLESTRRLQGELASSMVASQTTDKFLQANISLNPVIGQIQGVDGNLLVVKTQAGEQKVVLTNNVAVWGLEKASVSEVGKGAFIGVGATPQADGSQKAIRVIIFAEAMRGNGEGHRPWTRPNTTMTNATVDTTVSATDGQNIMVKYKDGEKKIVIGSDAVIMAYVVGEKSELKPGANIAINAATKKPDGSLEANRINVGRGDVVPN
jgi:hypothetical protein